MIEKVCSAQAERALQQADIMMRSLHDLTIPLSPYGGAALGAYHELHRFYITRQ